MRQVILRPDDRVLFANPFLRQMDGGRAVDPAGPALDAPLPISSASVNPAVLDSITGFFSLSLPSLHLLALAGEATRLALAPREWLSLLVVVQGQVEIRQHDTCLVCSPGDALFLPESTALWTSSAYDVVCLMVSVERLKDDLKALTYQGYESVSPAEWNFSQPVLRKSDDGALESSLLSTFQQLLRLTSELVREQPGLFSRLGIAKQLCLLTALLASPEVSASLAKDQALPRQGGVADAIDDLIVYMQNNLSEPLNLTILERYSHYSRRALQYAFRQRFGCTITQWLRAHRLDLAHELLQRAQPGDTVASIMRDCGYRSVSLFSLDFQKRFHIKPSALLRQHTSKFGSA
jgi:AraC-like DNA-binding protein